VVPLLFLAVAFNYLDRTALAFASLQMNADLQLSTQEYGLAAATFALGAAASLVQRKPSCTAQLQMATDDNSLQLLAWLCRSSLMQPPVRPWEPGAAL
jgi:soluble lytic murein transglycosylase-like protein